MLKMEYDRSKHQPKRGLKRAVSLACLIAGMTGVCCAAASDFASRSYPVPINIDSTFVRSSLYLQFQVRDYNLSVADFAKGNLSPEELLFVRAAQDIHSRNSASLSEIWGDTRPRKATSSSSMKLSEITPSQVAAEYAADFVDFQKPKLITEVLAGLA